MKILLMILGLASGTAFADNVPPGFDLAKYQQLTRLAAQKGTSMPTDTYEYRVLTHLNPPDTTKTHTADYFSAVGGVDSSTGKFDTAEISMESENWVLNSQGNFAIDEWNWTASLTGELVDLNHVQLVETPDGEVLDYKPIPEADVTDPAELARWNAKVVQWYGFTN